MRRFLILDPGVVDHTGHHPNVLREVANAARKAGFSVSIYGHKWMSKKLRADLDIIPHFSVFTYNPHFPVGFKRGALTRAASELAILDPRFRNWRITSRGLHFDLRVAMTTRDLRRIGFQEDDIVFLHSGQCVQFESVCRFMKDDKAMRPSRIHFEFGVNSGAHPSARGTINAFALPDPKVDIRPYFYAMSRRVHQDVLESDRLVFGAFTRDVADSFSRFLDMRVDAFPLPSKAPQSARDRQKPARPVIGILGYQTPAKGYHFVPDIVRKVQALRPECHFLIHNSYLKHPAHTEVSGLAKGNAGVTLVEGPADHKMWWSLIDRCDIIVCPYEPARYQGSYSAIMGEAILAGVPAVGPANTSLAVMAETYGSGFVPFGNWKADAISESVVQSIDKFEQLLPKSKLASRKWQEKNGAELLVKRLALNVPTWSASPV